MDGGAVLSPSALQVIRPEIAPPIPSRKSIPSTLASPTTTLPGTPAHPTQRPSCHSLTYKPCVSIVRTRYAAVASPDIVKRPLASVVALAISSSPEKAATGTDVRGVRVPASITVPAILPLWADDGEAARSRNAKAITRGAPLSRRWERQSSHSSLQTGDKPPMSSGRRLHPSPPTATTFPQMLRSTCP